MPSPKRFTAHRGADGEWIGGDLDGVFIPMDRLHFDARWTNYLPNGQGFGSRLVGVWIDGERVYNVALYVDGEWVGTVVDGPLAEGMYAELDRRIEADKTSE